MTDLTREQLETLLDGATQGPWQADGEPWNRIVWSSAENRVCFMAHSNGLDDARDIATSNLVAAAPDLARQLLATMTERDEAQAAQAGVVEEAARIAKNCVYQYADPVPPILALADPTGVRLLAGLRAERDALKKKLISPDPYEDTAHPDDHAVNRFAAVMKGKLAAKRLQGRGGWQEPEVPNGYLSRLLREHVDKGDPVDVANLAMMIHQRGERIAPQNEGASCKAIDDAIAERDRLAAANAVLEAKVAGLRRDALILLAQIDGVEDATGEAPEGEDAILVAEIRAALSATPTTIEPSSTSETHAQAEDRICSCGAGHGSLEGHLDWCDWISYLALPTAPIKEESYDWRSRGTKTEDGYNG